MRTFFITGTDTGVGKTTVGVALLKAFREQDLTTAAIKPIATGCVLKDSLWVSEDNQRLQEAASVKHTKELSYPFYFEPPTAPSIAAALVGRKLSAKAITNYIDGILSTLSCDVTLIEGVGGWHVPLNEQETMSGVVRGLKVPVILVVGVRLGCINHALLTYEAIQTKGSPCVGWIANNIDPVMSYAEETIETIRLHLPVPFLGVLPYPSQSIQPFAPALYNL